MPFSILYIVIGICFGCIPLLMIPWSTRYFLRFAENLTDNKIVKGHHFLLSSAYITTFLSIQRTMWQLNRDNFVRNANKRSDEWRWAHVFTCMSSENTDLLTWVPVTSHFYFHLCVQNSKVCHFQIIPTQNTSVAQKNYSEMKCSGTLSLSSYSQHINFARLIMEQHCGENSRFSIKERKYETFCETHANLTPPILMHLE